MSALVQPAAAQVPITVRDCEAIYPTRHAPELTVSASLSAEPDLSSRDPYRVLGVARTASSGEIRKSYKKLSLSNHPDKSRDPEAKKKFAAISNAYQVSVAYPWNHFWRAGLRLAPVRSACEAPSALQAQSLRFNARPRVSDRPQILSNPDKRAMYDDFGGDELLARWERERSARRGSERRRLRA